MRQYLFLTGLFFFFGTVLFAGIIQKKEILFNPGFGVITYTDYLPFKDKPIKIYYYIPEDGKIQDMPILMAMHGGARDAKELMEAMAVEAKVKKVMVFAPEFALKFYAISEYQEVGLVTENQVLRKESDWTVQVIDQIFEFIIAHSASNAKKYDIYGHSAGGQFVHRFMLFHNSPYVGRAMVGSPGWYTFPDTTMVYPYGIKNTPFANKATIRAFLMKKIILHLGTKDTIRESFLRVTPETEKQGRNRYERGEKFYLYLQNLATTNGWKFNWTKVETPDVPHDSKLMGKIGLNYLYK
ncbi:MAG: hypothetical protein WCK18_13740 [Prolixibacteraceae bacterium]